MGGIVWSETLRGPLSFDQEDFNQAMLEGRRDGAGATLALTLKVDDVERFERDPWKVAHVLSGHLDCPDLGGRLEARGGWMQQFVQADALLDHQHLRMRYRVRLLDPAGRKLCLEGFKLIENDPGYDSWADTTTLFTRIHRGWRSLAVPEDGEDPWARGFPEVPAADGANPAAAPAQAAGPAGQPIAGEHPAGEAGGGGGAEGAGEAEGADESDLVATAVLQISRPSFLRELTTFRGTALSRRDRARDVLRFEAGFAGSVARAYVGAPIPDGRPSFPCDRPRRAWQADPEAEWHDVPGRERAVASEQRLRLQREIIPLQVKQLPFPINLHHIAQVGEDGERRIGDKGPVLLAHGAGVRAEMFYGQPRHQTLVDALLAAGYDVWALNWRGSIDLPNVPYTLDQAARFDHPVAVQEVLDRSKARSLRAVVHCQGSVSFMMAAVAGLLPRHYDGRSRVSHVVSSAISLFFDVPKATWRKQQLTLPVVRRLGAGADPQWGIRAINATGAGLALASRLLERPCRNVPCQIANYIYGSGWDVLLNHDNIDDEVHAWTARELGYTPFTLIGQVAESTRNGRIVAAGPFDEDAPVTYVDAAPEVRGTRFTLLGCGLDAMFLPSGQQRTDAFLKDNKLKSDYVMLPGYGHMDAYWGPNAHEDVFPVILDGLSWSDSQSRPSVRERARVRPGRPQVAPERAHDQEPLPRRLARRNGWTSLRLARRVRVKRPKRCRRSPDRRFTAPPPPRSRVTQPPDDGAANAAEAAPAPPD
jgi:hypothetical protein